MQSTYALSLYLVAVYYYMHVIYSKYICYSIETRVLYQKIFWVQVSRVSLNIAWLHDSAVSRHLITLLSPSPSLSHTETLTLDLFSAIGVLWLTCSILLKCFSQVLKHSGFSGKVLMTSVFFTLLNLVRI